MNKNIGRRSNEPAVGQLVRVKSECYPFYWSKPNLFICEEITDHGFALLKFADGEAIPDGSYQGAYVENIELVNGQLALFEEAF
jgi:hypothetical protein